MERYSLYIDGQSSPAASGEWFDTANPYTGETWAQVAKGGPADVDRAVKAAHRAFTEGPWPAMTASQRGMLLQRIVATSLSSLAVVGALALPAGQAAAQAFPSKPIHLVVPFPGGSAVDSMMRVLAQPMSAKLGQPVLVEPKPGAGAIIGTQYVIGQPGDGYTLIVITPSAAVKSAIAKPPFDIRKDLVHVGQFSSSPLVLAFNANAPFKTIRELVAYGKANPGKLNFGSYGIGTLGHLAGELFAQQQGYTMTHVAYNGSTQASLSLAQGDVSFSFDTLGSLNPHVQSGKIRLIASSTAERSPAALQIPGMAESGVAQFDLSNWGGISASAGTPADTVEKLNAALQIATREQASIDYFTKAGLGLRSSTAAAFGTMVNRNVDVFAKLIRDAKLDLE